jgi:hypothetical protein
MGTFSSKYISTGLFFIFILISGFWLSRSGKPINSLVLTIHKLIGLGAGIYLVVTVNRLRRVAALSGNDILVTVITGIVFLALVATGGLLSVDKSMPDFITKLHHFLPYLAMISTGGTLYILFGGI